MTAAIMDSDPSNPTPDSPPPRPSAPAPAPPLSAVAVVALVLACIPCAGIGGMMLGILAHRRIRRSGGQLRGARLAIAAMIIGFLSTTVTLFVVEKVQIAVNEQIDRDVQTLVLTVLEDAAAGRTDAVIAAFQPPATPPTADEIRVFADTVRERYGALSSFAAHARSETGSFKAPQAEIAGAFRFERESPSGVIRVQLQTVQPLKLTPRIIGILIEDPERGDLQLGQPIAEVPE